MYLIKVIAIASAYIDATSPISCDAEFIVSIVSSFIWIVRRALLYLLQNLPGLQTLVLL